MQDRAYTTHEIAEFCKVYPSSVVNWINSGKLRSFQTAGGHHRVRREDLLAFLGQLNAPIPREILRVAPILVVDDDVEFVRVVKRAFARRASEFVVEACFDGVEALIRIGEAPPPLVVLDMVLPKLDGVRVCTVLKSKPETSGIKIIAVTGKSIAGLDKKLAGKVDALMRKPLDVVELVDRARELLGLGLMVPEKR